jgi:hypothetical protein
MPLHQEGRSGEESGGRSVARVPPGSFPADWPPSFQHSPRAWKGQRKRQASPNRRSNAQSLSPCPLLLACTRLVPSYLHNSFSSCLPDSGALFIISGGGNEDDDSDVISKQRFDLIGLEEGEQPAFTSLASPMLKSSSPSSQATSSPPTSTAPSSPGSHRTPPTSSVDGTQVAKPFFRSLPYVPARFRALPQDPRITAKQKRLDSKR